MKRIISENAPKAIGPYSHAVESQQTVYVSGQLGIDPECATLLEGVEAQAHQAMKNLHTIAVDCGTALENIVKTTIF